MATEDTIKVFVTTDNHVGYNELDPVRGGDAAASFDESMRLAVDHKADLVLQGGDMFHANKPSKRAMYDVVSTLRHYCLGDDPIEFEVLNHGSMQGPTENGSEEDSAHRVNYYDPNINVSLPVFAISGNHDDAGGAKLLSPLDVLAEMGLINHFGRVPENDHIVITPVLIRKGASKLALYGLANVRDERLHRMFRDGKVQFSRPAQNADSWFSILCVHQNRTAHAASKNYLPEEFLPGFLDLVIWGHEHQSLVDPVENKLRGFRVIQPGSSVATSLHESESGPKNVCMLKIGPHKSFSYDKIPLHTVRPFVMRQVNIAGDAPPTVTSLRTRPADARVAISAWLGEIVETLIGQAEAQWRNAVPRGPDEEPPLPLIRLRVDYTGYEVENPTRFSRRFEGRVANTSDILLLYKQVSRGSNRTSEKPQGRTINPPDLATTRLQDIVREELAGQHLKTLPISGMLAALESFVDKDEKLAVKQFVDATIDTRVEQIVNEFMAESSAEVPDSQEEQDATRDLASDPASIAESHSDEMELN